MAGNAEGPAYVSHLESAIDGTRLEAGVVQAMHAGRPLWVRYDLKAIAAAVDRDSLCDQDHRLTFG